MLKPRYLKIIFFLLLSLSKLNSYANDNDAAPVEPTAFTVHIDETIIDATGIQTLKLHSTQFSPEIKTFATRVDLSPLIAARKEYFTALAKQATANITLKQSQKNTQHLKNLQRENAISTRKFLAQKSQMAIDKAIFEAAEQHAVNIQLQTHAKWGKVLTHWFLTELPPYSNMLNALNRPVYLIFLPVSFTSPLEIVTIQPSGLLKKVQPASLISAAPNHSAKQQTGMPFFYLSEQTSPVYHQRVAVWLPLKKGTQSGFIIPESAIVWHLGLPYVYLQVNEELFKRVKITRKKLISTESYFIQDPLQEGDILVSTGAQMLLSEEFRGQIPAEDDDDDDDDD